MKYFNKNEFNCKCGCGLNNMQEDILEMIDNARDIANIPFVITSGSRCKNHNKAIGGSKTSSHINGLAIDIKCSSSSYRYDIVSALLEVGFDRIGIAKSFIHCDKDLDKPSKVTWVY